MLKPGTLLILITALVWSSFASPDTIMKSLKQNFILANGKGHQYGVLYLHKGNIAQIQPVYDVQGQCSGGLLNRQITNCFKEVGTEEIIRNFKPPVWPTNSLPQLQCQDHPNIAVAGVNQEMPKNTGHMWKTTKKPHVENHM